MPKKWLNTFLISCLFLASGAAAQAQDPKLRIEGVDGKSSEFRMADMRALPQASFELTDHDGKKTEYEGVPLIELLRKAGAPLGEKLRGKEHTVVALIECSDGYRVAFTLGELAPEFGARQILLAYSSYGEPLPAKVGPLRLVVPGDKRLARSARMVQRIRLIYAQAKSSN